MKTYKVLSAIEQAELQDRVEELEKALDWVMDHVPFSSLLPEPSPDIVGTLYERKFRA